MLIRCLIAVSVSLLISACASVLDRGGEAFNRGQYDIAATYWTPLAKNGDYSAQYNLGILAEQGFGRPANADEASGWYWASAKQGFTPAMIALARVQRRAGHAEPAVSWLTLAARWNDQQAVTLLRAWNQPVPNPDLHAARELNRLRANQRAAKIWGPVADKVGYAVGCGISGGCSSGSRAPSYGASSIFSLTDQDDLRYGLRGRPKAEDRSDDSYFSDFRGYLKLKPLLTARDMLKPEPRRDHGSDPSSPYYYDPRIGPLDREGNPRW